MNLLLNEELYNESQDIKTMYPKSMCLRLKIAKNKDGFLGKIFNEKLYLLQ